MKPLPAAPLTDADWVIWCLRYRSMDVGSHPGPWLRIQAGDRRDAALMLRAQRFRSRGYSGPFEATPLHEWPQLLRGEDLPERMILFGGDISSCASGKQKPILVASLTPEDLLIWLAVDHGGLGLDLFRLARAADRRDAELMLEALRAAGSPRHAHWRQHILWATWGMPYWEAESCL